MGVSRGKFSLIGIYYSSILYLNLLEIHIIIEIYTQKTVKVEKILEVKYFVQSLLFIKNFKRRRETIFK